MDRPGQPKEAFHVHCSDKQHSRPLNLTDNNTTFFQEASEGNTLAFAGVVITLNNAIDSTLHMRGKISANGPYFVIGEVHGGDHADSSRR